MPLAFTTETPRETISTHNENDKPIGVFDGKQVAPPHQTERSLWTLATLSEPVKYYVVDLKS